MQEWIDQAIESGTLSLASLLAALFFMVGTTITTVILGGVADFIGQVA